MPEQDLTDNISQASRDSSVTQKHLDWYFQEVRKRLGLKNTLDLVSGSKSYGQSRGAESLVIYVFDSTDEYVSNKVELGFSYLNAYERAISDFPPEVKVEYLEMKKEFWETDKPDSSEEMDAVEALLNKAREEAQRTR